MRQIDFSMPTFEGMPSFPADPPFGMQPVPSTTPVNGYGRPGLSFGSNTRSQHDLPRTFCLGHVPADRLDCLLLRRRGGVGDADRATLTPG